MYKRYIKNGKKRYGPYTYESKRVNGKVVSRYVCNSSAKKGDESLFAVLLRKLGVLA